MRAPEAVGTDLPTDVEDLDESARGGRPSVDTVVTAIVGALSFLIAVRPALDNDLWFHLRTAAWMLDHQRWVGRDPFTHTRPDVMRVQTDWIGQLGLHGAWSVAGLVGVAVLVAALLAIGLVVLHRSLDGPVRVRAGVTLATAVTSSIFFSARTHTFTFLGLCLLVALVTRWRRDPTSAALWWAVPLCAVWVNAHGGVIYGLLVLYGTFAGEVANRLWAAHGPAGVLGGRPLDGRGLRRLGAVAAASTLVLAVNPSGWRAYGLPFHQVSASVQFVQEYRPPSPLEPAALPFFALLLVTVALLVHRRRSLDLVELFLVAGTLAFALRFTRSIPFFAVVAAPIVARHLAALVTERDPEWRPDARAPGALLGVAALVVGMTLVLTAAKLDGDRVEARRATEFPVAAVAWIEANQPPHELFNTFDWGGFVMWELPGYRVSVDARTDVYDDFLLTYHDVVTAAPGWEVELDREGIGTVLVDPGLPVTAALRADADWAVAYEDGVAVVFTRA